MGLDDLRGLFQRGCVCVIYQHSISLLFELEGGAKSESCGQDPRLMTGKRVGIEHANKVIPIYPFPWNY